MLLVSTGFKGAVRALSGEVAAGVYWLVVGIELVASVSAHAVHA